MRNVLAFVKKEIVLSIAFLAAVVSCCFVPPDGAYLGYLDWRTLALLFCLMSVVSEMQKAEAFSLLSHVLCSRSGSTRKLALILVFLSFFSAMFITNDVALLTFVPFSVMVLTLAKQEKYLVRVVVLQTAAANLGSMLTPVGNPQNIYIQSFYNLGTGEFLRITGPVWIAALVLLGALCFTVGKAGLQVALGEPPVLQKGRLWVGIGLFAVCLLTVLRVLSWPVMLGIVLAAFLIYDRDTLASADFPLLLTFVCFFVFSGNLARIEAVSRFIRSILLGREYLVGLGVSQVISNVPAALLLSGFTDNARALLLGVNVGGLGTPVASLASLISLKLYSREAGASVGRFLGEFTLVNLLLMVLLSIPALLLL